MGSYLATPNTEKKSENFENSFLKVGASAMQGWRINQEDAHNVILDFDKKTAFLAVYDGHGGSEVAEYCSLKLAEFLKQTEAYKNGNLEEALKEAFLGFDATLLKESVVEELKLLAKKNPDYADEEEMEDDVYENIQDLRHEATMPLSKVLEKYKEKPESLSQSPCLKGKKCEVAGSSGSSCSEMAGGPSSSSSGMAGSSGSSKSSSSSRRDHSDDSTVSSSSSKPIEEVVDAPSSSSSDVVVTGNGETPDSSSTTQPEKTNEVDHEASASEASSSNPTQQQNGEITAIKSADEAITSSSVVENGEVGCSSGGSVGGSSASAISISSSSPVAAKKPAPIEETDSDESTDDEYKHDQPESDSEEEMQESDGSGSEDVDVDEEDDEEEGLCDEDEKFMNSMVDEPGKDSGCTAVVAVLQGHKLFVANAGDSRCIVSRGGTAVPMSFDHKPEDEPEYNRIIEAGGRVSTDGRVNGGLNLSRAIGDHGYKTNKDLPAAAQMISALPDIKTLTLTEEDEFMVLACDGIWNFMTNVEVRDFVKERLDAGVTTLSKICEELFEKCLAPDTQGDGTGCDNMTAMIIQFKDSIVGKTVPIPQKRSIDSSELNEVENLDSKRQKIAEADDEAPATVTST